MKTTTATGTTGTASITLSPAQIDELQAYHVPSLDELLAQPRPGTPEFAGLDPVLQRMIEARDALLRVVGALSAAERRARVFEDSDVNADREEWRWLQDVSSAAYKLWRRVDERSELDYVTYLARCERETHDGAHGDLATLEAKRRVAQLRVLAQEA